MKACQDTGFIASATLSLDLMNEAVAFHIEGLLDAGKKIPSPQSVEIHSGNPAYAGMI